MTVLDLRERFARRIKKNEPNLHDPNDERVAAFTKELLVEAGIDAGDDRIAPGIEAEKLLALMARDGELPHTKRVLHNAMFAAWVNTEKQYNSTIEREYETRMVLALLRHPSFSGTSSIVAEWEAAVDTAMKKCFDQAKLLRLLVLATKESNKTLVSKAMARMVEMMALSNIAPALFMAKCLDETNGWLTLVEEACLKSIGQAARTAELARTFKLPYGAPVQNKLEMLSADRIVYTWWTAPHADHVQKHIEEVILWVEEARKQIASQLSQKTEGRVTLQWHILTHIHGWEHRREELAPIHTVTRTI